MDGEEGRGDERIERTEKAKEREEEKKKRRRGGRRKNKAPHPPVRT